MQLLEEYIELIERDAREISVLWKYIQILFYFLSAITGYCCSILFYIFEVHIFGNRCPLWANVYLFSQETQMTAVIISNQTQLNWRGYIVVSYESRTACEAYFFAALSSCMFGVVGIALFSVYGKGGYNIKIITAPWRIVFPALIFNVCFSLIMTSVVSNLKAGYNNFSNKLESVFNDLPQNKKPNLNIYRNCDIIKSYTITHKTGKYDVCILFIAIEVLSWIMMWSWIGGVVVLILRIIMVTDFRLLKVKVYQLPCSTVPSTLQNMPIESSRINDKNEKKKQM